MSEFYLSKNDQIIGIERDEYYDFDPRKDKDNLGVIFAPGRSYNEAWTNDWDTFLGGYDLKRSGNDREALYRDINNVMEAAKERGDVMLPLTIYSHGGEMIFVGEPDDHFDGDWDCSFIGFIYADKETIEKENITYDIAVQNLEGEVREMNAYYFTGEVYVAARYDLNGNEIDWLGGYLDIEDAIKDLGGITDDGIVNRDYDSVDEFIEDNADRINQLKSERIENAKQNGDRKAEIEYANSYSDICKALFENDLESILNDGGFCEKEYVEEDILNRIRKTPDIKEQKALLHEYQDLDPNADCYVLNGGKYENCSLDEVKDYVIGTLEVIQNKERGDR